MPFTAFTMLVGCLAIAGAGMPFVDRASAATTRRTAILAQALVVQAQQSAATAGLFFVAAGGAAITAFYMFRLWFMTFAGKPRDQHVYDHAHESPKVMYVSAGGAGGVRVGVGWTFLRRFGVQPLLEQARPAGIGRRRTACC